jgi:catechol 2,3-dioxygenase-like lactoylglutathione lyase family enzyme
LRISTVLHHVTHELLAAQLEPCIAFYEGLGFTRAPTPEGIGDRAIWLQSGPTQIHLMPQTEPSAPARAGHIAIVVEQYESTLQRLRASGLEVEPRREHWGAPRSFVRDPAGHLVEMMAWPPQDA